MAKFSDAIVIQRSAQSQGYPILKMLLEKAGSILHRTADKVSLASLRRKRYHGVPV
jgi:hypothetical protein